MLFLKWNPVVYSSQHISSLGNILFVQRRGRRIFTNKTPLKTIWLIFGHVRSDCGRGRFCQGDIFCGKQDMLKYLKRKGNLGINDYIVDTNGVLWRQQKYSVIANTARTIRICTLLLRRYIYKLSSTCLCAIATCTRKIIWVTELCAGMCVCALELAMIATRKMGWYERYNMWYGWWKKKCGMRSQASRAIGRLSMMRRPNG